MNAKILRFRANEGTPDRMKLPGTFWARLKSMGLTPASVIRHSQLPPTVYSDDSVVTTAQLFRLWIAIRELTNDSTLGWKGMRNTASDQFHPALLAALNARSFRESLDRLARYKQLCGAQEFQFTRHTNECHVEVFWPFAKNEEPPTLFLDAVFALVMELGRRGTESPLTPKRVELRRSPDTKDGLAGYFGCPVKYGAKRNVLVLHAADLELPFKSHNEELLKLLAPHLEQELNASHAKRNVSEQTKWVLKRLLSGSPPDVAVVAKELGLSARTLQRRITEEGTSFRQLLNETRRERVREYLSDESIEISEIAFLLGYDNANSFYRAFRSWEGQTPAEWRANPRPLKPGKASA